MTKTYTDELNLNLILKKAMRVLCAHVVALGFFGVVSVLSYVVMLFICKFIFNFNDLMFHVHLLFAGISIIISILFTALISPFLFRIYFPCKKVTDQNALKTIEGIAIQKGLSSPSIYEISLPRGQAPTAMSVGLMSGRGWFKSALFFESSVLKELAPEELKAVAFHELGHLYLGHYVKRIIGNILGLIAAVVLINSFSIFAWIIFPKDVFIVLFPLNFLFVIYCHMTISLKIYWRQELEADSIALKWGAKFESLCSSLQKLATERNTRSKISQILSQFSTHPPLKQRVSFLAKLNKDEAESFPTLWEDLGDSILRNSPWVTPILTFFGLAITYAWIGDLWPKSTLWSAAYRGNLETVQRLVFAGVNPNSANIFQFGSFPLLAAASKNHVKVVSYLLDKGADLEQVHPQSGMTALMVASKEGNLDVVKFLISKGANTEAKDFRGKTPLSFAKDKNHLDVVALLTNTPAQGPSSSDLKRELAGEQK